MFVGFVIHAIQYVVVFEGYGYRFVYELLLKTTDYVVLRFPGGGCGFVIRMARHALQKGMLLERFV